MYGTLEAMINKRNSAICVYEPQVIIDLVRETAGLEFGTPRPKRGEGRGRSKVPQIERK